MHFDLRGGLPVTSLRDFGSQLARSVSVVNVEEAATDFETAERRVARRDKRKRFRLAPVSRAATNPCAPLGSEAGLLRVPGELPQTLTPGPIRARLGRTG